MGLRMALSALRLAIMWNYVPSPGSGLAASRGCTCPKRLNNEGRGGLPEPTTWEINPDAYVVNPDCPLHGDGRDRAKA